jgi:hypothetical protein
VEIRRIAVQGQPGQRVSETPISTEKLNVLINFYNPSYMGGIRKMIMIQSGPGKSTRPYPKKQKGLGIWLSGRVPVSQHKALSSNPNTTKIKTDFLLLGSGPYQNLCLIPCPVWQTLSQAQ